MIPSPPGAPLAHEGAQRGGVRRYSRTQHLERERERRRRRKIKKEFLFFSFCPSYFCDGKVVRVEVEWEQLLWVSVVGPIIQINNISTIKQLIISLSLFLSLSLSFSLSLLLFLFLFLSLFFSFSLWPCECLSGGQRFQTTPQVLM